MGVRFRYYARPPWRGRKRLGHRRKGILFDFRGDGLHPTEWWPPFWRRYWRRWLRRFTSTISQLDADQE